MCHDDEEKAFKHHFSLNDPSYDNLVTLTPHILMRFCYKSSYSLLFFTYRRFRGERRRSGTNQKWLTDPSPPLYSLTQSVLRRRSIMNWIQCCRERNNQAEGMMESASKETGRVLHYEIRWKATVSLRRERSQLKCQWIGLQAVACRMQLL